MFFKSLIVCFNWELKCSFIKFNTDNLHFLYYMQFSTMIGSSSQHREILAVMPIFLLLPLFHQTDVTLIILLILLFFECLGQEFKMVMYFNITDLSVHLLRLYSVCMHGLHGEMQGFQWILISYRALITLLP